MKVTGPGQTQSTSNTKKTGKTNAAGAGFEDYMNAGAQPAAPAQTGHAIVMVDALLAVQGAEDPTARAARKRMRERSENILGMLDKIRLAMLNGTMTVGHMVDIADVVASHREKISDPALTAIMDEIDLRAQVELAKMRQALEARKA